MAHTDLDTDLAPYSEHRSSSWFRMLIRLLVPDTDLFLHFKCQFGFGLFSRSRSCWACSHNNLSQPFLTKVQSVTPSYIILARSVLFWINLLSPTLSLSMPLLATILTIRRCLDSPCLWRVRNYCQHHFCSFVPALVGGGDNGKMQLRNNRRNTSRWDI